jgi:hypothetical protein
VQRFRENIRIMKWSLAGVSSSVALAISLGNSIVVEADEFNHRYSQGDKVNFYVHKVSFHKRN